LQIDCRLGADVIFAEVVARSGEYDTYHGRMSAGWKARFRRVGGYSAGLNPNVSRGHGYADPQLGPERRRALAKFAAARTPQWGAWASACDRGGDADECLPSYRAAGKCHTLYDDWKQ
jgi:hypothetical protein